MSRESWSPILVLPSFSLTGAAVFLGKRRWYGRRKDGWIIGGGDGWRQSICDLGLGEGAGALSSCFPESPMHMSLSLCLVSNLRGGHHRWDWLGKLMVRHVRKAYTWALQLAVSRI